MSGLFGGGTISNEAEKLAAIRIQTSAYGRVIPVVYGTARIAGNLLWTGGAADFVRSANTTQQKSGGILGIGAVKTQNTTYTYSQAIALGLCEGPITGIGIMWSEKAYDLFSVAAAKYGFLLFTGSSPQSVWSWLTTKHPSEAIPYDGIAFIANPAWPLDGNASLPNMSFEVGGFCQVGGGNVDANTAVIIADLLTNQRYGMGWDPSRLDLADFQAYCTAAGIFVSPAYTEQKTAADAVKQLLEAAVADGIWSGGKLKVIPYADAAITGNGVTWTPAGAVFDLTDDDFLVEKDSGAPPVTLKRKQPSDVYNVVQVQHEPRRVANTAPPYVLLTVPSYNTSVQEAKDDALIALYGERRGQPLDFPMIRDAALARTTAQRILQRGTAILNQYEFRLGWRHALLEPMDWGYITDAQLGLVRAPVRFVEVSEDEYGTISVVAEDYPGGGTLSPTGTIPGGSSSGTTPNTGAAPGTVQAPVIFEAPGSLASTSAAELWVAVTGADPNWGGCNVWMSTDGGTSYQKVAVQPQGSRYGALTALLAAWGSAPSLDTTHTLAVALLGNTTDLASVTAAEVAAGVTLCYVGGATREFLAFETATLTGTAAYNLTTLARALRGSTDGSHAIGAPFVRCDQAIVRIPFPGGFPAGTTVYFKFTSFNLYGGNEEDLGSVTAYPYTFANLGGPAGGNTTNPLSWKQAVRAATNAAGTLASSFHAGSVIDGVTLVTGDRILIKDQVAGAENGIYTVNASGAPTRATDADTGLALVCAAMLVSEGTANADTQWACTTNAPITLGTTALVFQKAAAGATDIAIAVTTASLANDATENGTITIAKSALLQKIVASAACWIRLYETAAERTADASRLITTSPKAGLGILSNAAPGLDSAGLTLPITPAHELHNGDGPRTTTIYYAITNKSGGTAAITATFTVLPLET